MISRERFAPLSARDGIGHATQWSRWIAGAAAFVLCPPLLVAGMIALAAGARAQVLEQVTSEQSAVIQRFSEPRAPGTINIAVPDLQRRIPPENAKGMRFTLRALRVDGAVAVPLAQLEPIWKDAIGRTISLADLYEMAAKVERAYTAAGYFSMAVVPVQDYRSGHVTIALYESYVSKVVIKSDRPGLEARLAPYINRITAMRPIRIKEAERILLLMSDLAGLKIDGVFKKPDTPSGGGDLTLDISFTRLTGAVILDNMGTAQMGPVQLAATATLNDVFGLFESTEFAGMTIPNTPREVLFGQVTQDIPIGFDGLHAGYRLGYISSHPGADLAPLNVEVSATFGNLFVSYPFLRTIEHSLFGRMELNFKNNEVDIGPELNALDDNRWLAASLRYLAEFEGGSATVLASVAQGLDDLGARAGGWAFPSRSGVPDDYRFVRLDLDVRKEVLAELNARLRMAAQYAFDPLPSVVRLNVGGDPFGRAFDSSTAAGDSGIAATFELSRALPWSAPGISGLQVFAFVDYAALWSQEVGVDYTDARLGSAGAGLRATLGDGLNAQLLIAVPWEDTAILSTTGTRVFVQMAKAF
ncbi:MAG: hypothetical protein B7Y95_17675 [Rhizobiales bacterium 32-66-11]|nr:MAG: hypothetical protein B7Y95_17675 [Rhizobiales bacterium 32-66-11]